MSAVKRFLPIGLSFLAIVAMFFLPACTVMPDGGSGNSTAEPRLPQPKALTDANEIELLSAIQNAAAGREDILAFLIYRVTIDHVDYSSDKSLALVWIALVDRETGLLQPGEPGLVIAHKTGDTKSPWRIVFQADANFAQELQAIPDKLLSADVKEHYMPAAQQQPKDPVVYTGYHLPWTNGQTVYLTGSIGHVYTYKSCPSTCLYAFDFANGTMFPVRAARRGTVKYAVWEYPNGNETNANYLVLEDTSTTPTTYQVYFHLAQNSIPTELRKVGAPVVQGQFIGNADDTGYSSGNHLHFHVHTNSTSYWGTSVDIVFDEVTVNGGRPRLCTEAQSYPELGSQCMPGNKYVSANADAEPPTGGITSPTPYTTITSPTLNVSGWMKDDVRVLRGQLYYNTGGSWTAIGKEITTSPFTQDIDLCAANIPNGKVFLSIKVQDEAGKFSEGIQGLTELTKAYTCPSQPPVCTVAENQAALYTAANFTGLCQVFELGDYPNLAAFPTNFLDNTFSIQVGAGVSAVLYPETDFNGLPELFQNGDADLSDNLIGAATAGSLRVMPRVVPPEPADLTLPEVITDATDLTLQWSVADSVETSSQLTGPDKFAKSLDWQYGGSWNVGILAPGTYSWTVQSRNLAGTTSITQEFDVVAKASPPAAHLDDLPVMVNSSAVNLTWKVLSGADRLDHFNIQYRIVGEDWQELPDEPAGYVRSFLFWGTPGATMQFRLQAVDNQGNAEEFNTIPEAETSFNVQCSKDEYEIGDSGDNSLAGAGQIKAGDTQTHNWCGAGDVDWLTIAAAQGDQFVFTTKAVSFASAAKMTLYEPDGATLIGAAVPVNVNAEGTLNWTSPVDGVYVLKLEPVDNRIVGQDTRYTINVSSKSTIDPTTLICGSAGLPVLLGGGYLAAKKAKKAQAKRMRAKNMGW
ncbi:MAG: peptidoglycan DD-metalloendopeptidase family protein [Veillonellaceae bacterium]|nr:peptidoglycan DD-metalloendopeptidase family protein [Veillonellaceae bacterium]